MSTIQEKERNKEVAAEILRQLAALPVPRMGFNFLLLAGADKKSFCAVESGLKFKIKHRNRNKINTIVIKLNGMDYYDIEFWNCRILDEAPYLVQDKVSEKHDVDVENMVGILAEEVQLS